MSIPFQIGSDPEVFGLKDGSLVSSIGLITGFPKKILPVIGGGIQEDNVAFEFNPAPASTKEEFISNTITCLNSLIQHVSQYDIVLASTVAELFPDELLESAMAKRVGCEAELSAWTADVLEAPELGNMRVAGGHIAVSWDCGDDFFQRLSLVKVLDLMLTLPLLEFEKDNIRRKYYGKPGSHRPKYISEYDAFNGIEYRVLSNFWIFDKAYMEFIYDTVQLCLDECQSLVSIAEHYKTDIINGINTSDSRGLRWLVRDLNPHLETLYRAVGPTVKSTLEGKGFLNYIVDTPIQVNINA